MACFKKKEIRSETLTLAVRFLAWIEERRLDVLFIIILCLTLYIATKPIIDGRRWPESDEIVGILTIVAAFASILGFLRGRRKDRAKTAECGHLIIMKLSAALDNIFDTIYETNKFVEKILDTKTDLDQTIYFMSPKKFQGKDCAGKLESFLLDVSIEDEVKSEIFALVPKLQSLEDRFEGFLQEISNLNAVKISIIEGVLPKIVSQNIEDFGTDIEAPEPFAVLMQVYDTYLAIWEESNAIATVILDIFDKISSDPVLREAIDESLLKKYHRVLSFFSRNSNTVNLKWKLFVKIDKFIYHQKIGILLNVINERKKAERPKLESAS